jgi:hypothetical protein
MKVEFLSIIGDDMSDILGKKRTTRWLVHTIFSLFLTVIMFNLLISIVADSFDRVKYFEKAADMKAKCAMLLNFGQFWTFLKKTLCCKKVEEGHLMYIHRFVYEDQEATEGSERWTGRVRTLATK